ncbi:hypothetical protein JCM5353_006716, partial [Sporobolomyces roseus]
IGSSSFDPRFTEETSAVGPGRRRSGRKTKSKYSMEQPTEDPDLDEAFHDDVYDSTKRTKLEKTVEYRKETAVGLSEMLEELLQTDVFKRVYAVDHQHVYVAPTESVNDYEVLSFSHGIDMTLHCYHRIDRRELEDAIFNLEDAAIRSRFFGARGVSSRYRAELGDRTYRAPFKGTI